MKVQHGQSVQVHYRGTLNDGTEFDNSRLRGDPIVFQVGDPRMIEGFSNAVVGMEEGATKTFTLEAEDAYGLVDPNAKQPVPREQFGPDFDFTIGGAVQGQGPQGMFLATIADVTDTEVILDMNHPLAGKALTFEVEVIATEGVPMANWNATMKKAELLEVAKSRGLSVNTRSTKAQIIDALSA
jgi:peptidylprolyl isomerase